MRPGNTGVSTCLKDDRDKGYLRWTKGEQNGHNEAKRCLREGSCGRSADRAGNTKTNQQDHVGSGAPQIDGASAKVCSKNPG